LGLIVNVNVKASFMARFFMKISKKITALLNPFKECGYFNLGDSY